MRQNSMRYMNSCKNVGEMRMMRPRNDFVQVRFTDSYGSIKRGLRRLLKKMEEMNKKRQPFNHHRFSNNVTVTITCHRSSRGVKKLFNEVKPMVSPSKQKTTDFKDLTGGN